MGVQVDEAGSDREPGEVEVLESRAMARHAAEQSDEVRIVNMQVDGRSAGPVVQARFAQDGVDHRSASAPDVT
jgi:hypothetical protein